MRFAALLAAFGSAAYSPGAYFESATVIIPHDDKIHRGGEDSAHTCSTLITVADGVGGWEAFGINPGLFSKQLTRGIKYHHTENPELTTRQLTVMSHRRAAQYLQGSATSVTVKIENESTISTTNIGDSGYALFHIEWHDEQPVLQLYY
jgi:protein phosphatase PTC7